MIVVTSKDTDSKCAFHFIRKIPKHTIKLSIYKSFVVGFVKKILISSLKPMFITIYPHLINQSGFILMPVMESVCPRVPMEEYGFKLFGVRPK